MADFAMRSALIALVLVVSACDGRRDAVVQGSITVKLPPARPATPAPGFVFQGSRKVGF